MTGQDKDRNEAHAALSDAIVAARTLGDSVAEDQLRHARELLAAGPAGANEADNQLTALAESRRKSVR